MTRDEALKIVKAAQFLKGGNYLETSKAEIFLEGYEQGVRDSAKIGIRMDACQLKEHCCGKEISDEILALLEKK
jgi:hypothetical protein